MQKQFNKNFYLQIQKKLRGLVLASSTTTYEQIISELQKIEEEVLYSDWGMYSNLTKKSLIEYIECFKSEISKKEDNIHVLYVYMFDKNVKEKRKKMHNRYLMDFKE